MCLLSPSGQRAEHEVARSWTERSRPRGQRPSGQEHERARFNVKRRLGANPRTGFVKVPLTHIGAKQVVRGDPLRPGPPRAGRDGSLRCDRESSAKQTRF